MSSTKFTSFKKFYPYYLSEHKNKINKLLHVIGSLFALFFLSVIIFLREYRLIPLSLLFGYFFAWVGHFIFEKNKPATFKYPIYSLMGDWVMLKDILLGKIKL
mgnify:FL=1|tara:strand:- start:978 stop:1286 length:309 start_codon:yes stop_codon:yes gene_type:complete